jgi:hypothetical protein
VKFAVALVWSPIVMVTGCRPNGAGDCKVHLCDSRQAGRNTDEIDGGLYTANSERLGFQDRRRERRHGLWRCAGGQRRRHVAFSGDEQGQNLAAVAASEWHRVAVAVDEDPWIGERDLEQERGHLPIVIHRQQRETRGRFIGNLDVQLARRNKVQRRGNAIDGSGDAVH